MLIFFVYPDTHKLMILWIWYKQPNKGNEWTQKKKIRAQRHTKKTKWTGERASWQWKGIIFNWIIFRSSECRGGGNARQKCIWTGTRAGEQKNLPNINIRITTQVVRREKFETKKKGFDSQFLRGEGGMLRYQKFNSKAECHTNFFVQWILEQKNEKSSRSRDAGAKYDKKDTQIMRNNQVHSSGRQRTQDGV